MNKFYITFDIEHLYTGDNNIVINSDSVVVIKASSYDEAEKTANKLFTKGYKSIINEQIWNIGDYRRKIKNIIEV